MMMMIIRICVWHSMIDRQLVPLWSRNGVNHKKSPNYIISRIKTASTRTRPGKLAGQSRLGLIKLIGYTSNSCRSFKNRGFTNQNNDLSAVCLPLERLSNIHRTWHTRGLCIYGQSPIHWWEISRIVIVRNIDKKTLTTLFVKFNLNPPNGTLVWMKWSLPANMCDIKVYSTCTHIRKDAMPPPDRARPYYQWISVFIVIGVVWSSCGWVWMNESEKKTFPAGKINSGISWCWFCQQSYKDGLWSLSHPISVLTTTQPGQQCVVSCE